jgi:hypothetical protein
MTTDQLLKMRDALTAALGSGVARVSTPQLGEVEYSSPAQIQGAIAWIDSQLELASPTARTFVMQSNRGTNGGWQ